MPPKRKSTGSSGPANKRAKGAAGSASTSAAAASTATPAPAAAKEKYEPPRSKRWAAVSGSANIDADYRMVWKNEAKAYSYITLCSAWYVEDEDDEDEDEDEDDEEDEDEEDENEGEEEESEDDADDDENYDPNSSKRLGPACDKQKKGGKKRCVCFKPLFCNPEHPWVISWAGFLKFHAQFTHAGLRDPDNFSMYTYNDHAGYGSLEVLQNLFLDFEEAAKEKRGDGWREQWAVCEAVVHWLLDRAGQLFTQIDDGPGVTESMHLVGRMFLSMLAQLDELGLVGDATAVQSLGCTMAMYMVLASEMRRDFSALEDDRDPAAARARRFQPDFFDDAVLSYANRRGVTLRGPRDIEEVIAQASGDVDLPAKKAKDPWGWKAALKKYTKSQGGKIGGDQYDVTTMTSAERKAASFTKKDPLGKKDIDALKKGMVMTMR